MQKIYTYNYIYKITNTTNGKIYIGKKSSNKLDDKYFGSGKYLKTAIKKYGIEKFKKEFLAFTDNISILNFLEKFYIRKFNSTHKEIGYNLSNVGDGGNVTANFSIEEKEKINEKRSTSLKSYYSEISDFTKISRSKKISNSKKGKPISESHKRHILESGTVFQKGNTPWNKNKKISEETKEKIRNTLKGKRTNRIYKPLSEETKEKIRNTLKSKYKSINT